MWLKAISIRYCCPSVCPSVRLSLISKTVIDRTKLIPDMDLELSWGGEWLGHVTGSQPEVTWFWAKIAPVLDRHQVIFRKMFASMSRLHRGITWPIITSGFPKNQNFRNFHNSKIFRFLDLTLWVDTKSVKMKKIGLVIKKLSRFKNIFLKIFENLKFLRFLDSSYQDESIGIQDLCFG